jgi:hypothetical protein
MNRTTIAAGQLSACNSRENKGGLCQLMQWVRDYDVRKKSFSGLWLGSEAGEEQGGTVRPFGCNALALRAAAAAQDETAAGEDGRGDQRQRQAAAE